MAKTIGDAYINIKPNASGITSEISKALSGGLSGISSSVTGILGGVGKAAAGALAGATAAVGAFAKSSIDAGKSFDQSMSQVAATMGITMDEMVNQVGKVDTQWGEFSGNLREYAQFMGSHTVYSASEAADALNYMALAGYDAEKSMAMLPNVLNLAQAGALGLGDASDMVTDASSALGLSIDQTSVLIDQMAKASSKSNTSIGQLGEAILTVGGTAKNLSGGTEELATALGILADNGIKGSEGGTALRNVLLSLTPKSDAAAEAMERIGMNAYDANGEMRSLNDIFSDMANAMDGMSTQERQNTLSAIFNKVDLKSVSALMSAAVVDTTKVSEALNNAGISWEKYSDEAWMSAGGIDELVSEMVYNMEFLGTSTDELMDYLTSEYGLSSEDAAAAIDLVGSMADDCSNRFDDLSASIADSEGAAQDMANTMNENLAGDINQWNSALEGLQIAISDSLTPTLRDFVQFGTSGLSELTDAFKQGGLDGAMEAFGTILSNGVNMIVEKLPDIVAAGMKLLGALRQGIMDNAPMIINAAVEIISMFLQEFISALPEILNSGIEIILELVMGISQALPDLIPAAIDAILEFIDGLIDNIDLLLDAAAELIIGLALGLVNALPKLLEKAPIIMAKFQQALIKLVPEFLKVAVEIILKIAVGLVANVYKLVTAAGQVIKELFSGFNKGTGQFSNVGENIIQGLKNGISSAWNNLVSWWSGLFDDLIGIAKNILGIASPSKVFKQIGEYTTEGFDEGMKDFGVQATEDVQNAMDNISGIRPSIDATDVKSSVAMDYSLASATSTESSAADLSRKLDTLISLISNGMNVSLVGDAQGLFRQVRKEVNQFTKSTGNSPFIAPA